MAHPKRGSVVHGRRSRPKRAKAAARSAPRARYPVAEIVARLSHHRQRATYEAVGGIRRAPPMRVRGWFSGREAPENSFVVSRTSGEPTRYAPEQLDPALKAEPVVIDGARALRAWLRAHPIPGR